MKKLDPLARQIVTAAGLADLGYLIGYGTLHWRIPTLLLVLGWIMLTLHFWPEEKKP